jgi:diaminopimelate decarboxylase/SAM-dependent methyltransferase
MPSSPGVYADVEGRLRKLATEEFREKILIAGRFGRKAGEDIDVFIVLKEQDPAVIQDFLLTVKADVLDMSLEQDKLKVIPFRYSTSKPFLNYVQKKEGENFDRTLHMHFLLFPDEEAMLDWEDHEIVRYILNDLKDETKGNLWVGEGEIQRLRNRLKPRDFVKRRTTYEERFFSAIQDYYLNPLSGSVERARDSAAYAARYLSQDYAVSLYDQSPSSKEDVAVFMNKVNIPWSRLVTGAILESELAKAIVESFSYWRPVRKALSPVGVERLKEVASFSENLRSPIFIIDELKIRRNVKSISDAFSQVSLRCATEICYAIKANSIVPLVQFIADLTHGGLCGSSHSDLSTLRKVKADRERVTMHLNFQSQDAVLESVRNGYRIVASEIGILEVLSSVCEENNVDKSSVALFIRLRSSVANREGYHRMGVELPDLKKFITQFINQGFQPKGLAVHANAGSVDPVLWAKSLGVLNQAIPVWQKICKNTPAVIIGGGFASGQTLAAHRVSIGDFVEETGKVLANCKPARIIAEPGRYIVGDACYTYTRVKGVVTSDKNTTPSIVVDAGSNFLLPLHSRDYSFHDLTSTNDKRESYLVADSSNSFGALGMAIDVGVKVKGDSLLIGNCGAYTYSMASSSGDGIPTIKFLRERETSSRIKNSLHFVQNRQYLDAKYLLDRPLLKEVMKLFKSRISKRKVRVLDVGCGAGHYLKHLLDADLKKKLEYLGVDISQEMVDTASEVWRDYKNPDVTFSFIQGDVLDLSTFLESEEYDLVVGLSLMEYVKDDLAMHQLVRRLKPGGFLHLPINYDGVTQFEPTFDRKLEEKIISTFNDKIIPEPYCGRRLYHLAKDENLEIVEFNVDDWVIMPHDDASGSAGYRDGQELLLERVLSAFGDIGEGALTQAEKNSWLNMRHQQLKERELVFICRQCSLLARKHEY